MKLRLGQLAALFGAALALACGASADLVAKGSRRRPGPARRWPERRLTRHSSRIR